MFTCSSAGDYIDFTSTSVWFVAPFCQNHYITTNSTFPLHFHSFCHWCFSFGMVVPVYHIIKHYVTEGSHKKKSAQLQYVPKQNMHIRFVCWSSSKIWIALVNRQWVRYMGHTGNCVLIPGRGRDFSLLQNTQTASGVHPASYSMGNGPLAPQVKQPGLVADH
jgi:hypothetical protein